MNKLFFLLSLLLFSNTILGQKSLGLLLEEAYFSSSDSMFHLFMETWKKEQILPNLTKQSDDNLKNIDKIVFKTLMKEKERYQNNVKYRLVNDSIPIHIFPRKIFYLKDIWTISQKIATRDLSFDKLWPNVFFLDQTIKQVLYDFIKKQDYRLEPSPCQCSRQAFLEYYFGKLELTGQLSYGEVLLVEYEVLKKEREVVYPWLFDSWPYIQRIFLDEKKKKAHVVTSTTYNNGKWYSFERKNNKWIKYEPKQN